MNSLKTIGLLLIAAMSVSSYGFGMKRLISRVCTRGCGSFLSGGGGNRSGNNDKGNESPSSISKDDTDSVRYWRLKVEENITRDEERNAALERLRDEGVIRDTLAFWLSGVDPEIRDEVLRRLKDKGIPIDGFENEDNF